LPIPRASGRAGEERPTLRDHNLRPHNLCGAAPSRIVEPVGKYIELEHLRAVIGRARSLWRVNTPELDWQSILLEKAGEREHVLSEEEEEHRLFWALRPDFHPMARFAVVTGARLGNVIGLTWRQIDWDAGTIVFRVKSKKPGGELRYLPITRAVTAILLGERGHHP
jgi:integrase